ncbi:hypothetical protein BJV77DRAFT_961777 [Russula vinacea]|nr:hypothetical protein BJV77DRAFT_961777 [Russula vinacea]
MIKRYNTVGDGYNIFDFVPGGLGKIFQRGTSKVPASAEPWAELLLTRFLVKRTTFGSYVSCSALSTVSNVISPPRPIINPQAWSKQNEIPVPATSRVYHNTIPLPSIARHLYTGRKQKEHSFVGARAQGLKPATCVTTTSRLRIAAIFEAHHHKDVWQCQFDTVDLNFLSMQRPTSNSSNRVSARLEPEPLS